MPVELQHQNSRINKFYDDMVTAQFCLPGSLDMSCYFLPEQTSETLKQIVAEVYLLEAWGQECGSGTQLSERCSHVVETIMLL